MDFRALQEKAQSLLGISRFQLAQYKKKAEHGMGPLAGFTRFEIAEITRLFEKVRAQHNNYLVPR